jgi:hypothetical protein
MDTRVAGKRGGTARAAKLTPRKRSEIARKAVLARWKKWRAEKARQQESIGNGKAKARSSK